MSNADAASLGLTVAELQAVQAILRVVVPGSRVLAFGSRTNGKFRPYSDLDVAVFGSHPLTLRQLRVAQEAFEESTLRFRVDLCDGAVLSAEMRAIVLAGAVVVVECGNATAASL